MEAHLATKARKTCSWSRQNRLYDSLDFLRGEVRRWNYEDAQPGRPTDSIPPYGSGNLGH